MTKLKYKEKQKDMTIMNFKDNEKDLVLHELLEKYCAQNPKFPDYKFKQILNKYRSMKGSHYRKVLLQKLATSLRLNEKNSMDLRDSEIGINKGEQDIELKS
mmetsp:Transcript_11891/g.11807  ORF Transcript_11891/g.11807 Transcript_11891/m.11807 type:complete len:102 (+) Transcript_11891:283-588(+)